MREEEFTVSNSSGTYRLDKYLGEDVLGAFRLYRCVKEDDQEKWLIFKIATVREHNGVLDREAWLLDDLRDYAAETEEEYKRGGGSDLLNYHYAFPRVVASFLIEGQDGRRANVLGFDIADDIGELVPLSMIRNRDQVRVDLKTSAWIVGKLLKTLVFVHSCGVAVGDLTDSNLLLQRDNHLVSIFNWARAVRYSSNKLPCEVITGEIQAVAKAALRLLSARDGKTVPSSDQDPSGRYVKALEAMARGATSDALQVHTAFYKLVEELWGKKYHPWTTIPL